MTPAPIPAPVQASAPDLARRIGLIVAGLAALVARRFLREPRLVALIIPLWTRLTHTAGRFERLMSGLAANRAPKPRPPIPRPARPHRPTQDTARPTVLPAGHGWLIRALPHEAAVYATQLDALLAEPGTADLLAASPAAGRLLRPLARMLGLPAFAPKRNAPRRRPAAAPPCTTRDRPPPHRPGGPWPGENPPGTHHPGAATSTAPWPFTYRPSARWPAGCRRVPNPA